MASDAVNMAMLSGGMYGPNPYTHFPGGIPSPRYVGTPTDAHGDLIAPPPGVTLNTPPAAAAPTNPFAGVVDKQGMNAPGSTQRGGLDMQAWGQLTPAQRAAAYGPLGQYQAGLAMMPSGGPVASGNNPSGTNPTAQTALGFMNSGLSGFNQMQQPSTSAGPPVQPPPGTADLDSALLRLANPGHVTTPGANVSESGPTANQPNVLEHFLASQGGRTGAGGYTNQGFFDTLNALKAGSQTGGLGGLGGM